MELLHEYSHRISHCLHFRSFTSRKPFLMGSERVTTACSFLRSSQRAAGLRTQRQNIHPKAQHPRANLTSNKPEYLANQLHQFASSGAQDQLSCVLSKALISRGFCQGPAETSVKIGGQLGRRRLLSVRYDLRINHRNHRNHHITLNRTKRIPRHRHYSTTLAPIYVQADRM